MKTYRRAIYQEQKLEKEQLILQTARTLFNSMDYETINMMDIAQAAGIAKGTVYLYFKTKEGLFLSLLAQVMDEWFLELDQLLSVSGGIMTIGSFVDSFLFSLSKHSHLLRLISIFHIALENNFETREIDQFKNFLFTHYKNSGILIEQVLPFLNPGDGRNILVNFISARIGFENITNPSALGLRMQDKSDLFTLPASGEMEIKNFMLTFLRGLEFQKEL